MPYQRDAAAIVADWRAVEREIRAVNDGPTDPATMHAQLRTLHAEGKRLRNEYQELIEEALGRHSPVPIPLPVSDRS